MARYKRIDMNPRLLPVDLSRQISPGSFEFALRHPVDRLSLSAFESRLCNDQVGAPAYPPVVPLSTSCSWPTARASSHSRDIEAAGRENVVFMAISGDSHPHFTTIANFIATVGDAHAEVFAQLLAVCQQHGLIGGQISHVRSHEATAWLLAKE